MINYETTSFKDLFNELQETKIQLIKRLGVMEKTYQKTSKVVGSDTKAFNFLKFYYKTDKVNVVVTSAIDTLKVIDNILSDPKVSQHYINQLKSISEKDRKNGLEDYKQDWLKEIGTNDYSDIYVQASGINDWINDCRNIAYGLENFIGENNPVFTIHGKVEDSLDPEHLCEIRNGNEIFINGKNSKVTLPPALLSLLNKLLKKDAGGHYEIIKTQHLKMRTESKDAFRTNLKRLRKATSKLFDIQPLRTLDNSRGYKLVFKD